jgi:hypothetical protein
LPPEQLVPQEQRRPDRPVTFPVRLAAYRQAAVERERRVASVRPVALVRRAVVVLEHRAGLVHL